MSYRTNEDNIYKQGSFITARENPAANLIIQKYYQRIYYCTRVDDPSKKLFAYFERELIAPGKDS
jgi:hypothetical protein